MALRNLYKEIKGMKVKEVPAHLKPMLSIDYAKNAIRKGLDNYHANASRRATSSRAQTARRALIVRSDFLRFLGSMSRWSGEGQTSVSVVCFYPLSSNWCTL
ncbi:hypothetical protein K7X08_004215 [Anisodus acutangulus]|uniref:Uncharacterized protein n=1 Tax=Anisodus acutangulus TaxID=402998 RepID=A0A9Q1RJI9_9SOLA|nr:hypothetical protein K7X08_004215 [Anisodus acutangulus]